jgi:hypothetical protein
MLGFTSWGGILFEVLLPFFVGRFLVNRPRVPSATTRTASRSLVPEPEIVKKTQEAGRFYSPKRAPRSPMISNQISISSFRAARSAVVVLPRFSH